MLKHLLIVLLITGMLPSCFTEPKHTTSNRAVRDSVLTGTIVEPGHTEEEAECVFDTSTYQFTTKALLNYNPKQRYIWNKTQQEAVVPFENGDTLILHIGGCNHFSYLAIYRTDSAKFNQDAYLFEKATWLVETYFDNGFDKKYAHFIANKQYQLEESEQPGLKLYSIINPDTTVSNQVYEGFYFKKEGERTEIWIHGYLN